MVLCNKYEILLFFRYYKMYVLVKDYIVKIITIKTHLYLTHYCKREKYHIGYKFYDCTHRISVYYDFGKSFRVFYAETLSKYVDDILRELKIKVAFNVRHVFFNSPESNQEWIEYYERYNADDVINTKYMRYGPPKQLKIHDKHVEYVSFGLDSRYKVTIFNITTVKPSYKIIELNVIWCGKLWTIVYDTAYEEYEDDFLKQIIDRNLDNIKTVNKYIGL